MPVRVETMTSRERLLRCLRREPTDRAPVRLWGVNPFAAPGRPSYQLLIDRSVQRLPRMQPVGARPGEVRTEHLARLQHRAPTLGKLRQGGLDALPLVRGRGPSPRRRARPFRR